MGDRIFGSGDAVKGTANAIATILVLGRVRKIHSGGELCMAQTVVPLVSVANRRRLAAVLADRNRPDKHVARVRIILASARRLKVAEVARWAGLTRPAVWRWQLRYAESGVERLLRDKITKPGEPSMSEIVVRRVVALSCAELPGETTHWAGRMMAKVTGCSGTVRNTVCGP